MVYLMHACAGQVTLAGTPGGESDVLRGMADGSSLGTLAFSERGSRSHFWAPVSQIEGSGDDARLRAELNIFRGREVKTTGDGFLAIFDSAARAARCAAAMVRSAQVVEVQIRVGIHTGEVDISGGDARGIAVHTAARILAVRHRV